ncbi:DUF7344 domain-containing protein [Haloarchaeobius sp. DFWS5]|uniref:DUF7344 domain-containing protein n=1 Tax=Haloarchaeobius sp. DFWS5 TaxID=3446114 RepID=UPI003EB762D3
MNRISSSPGLVVTEPGDGGSSVPVAQSPAEEESVSEPLTQDVVFHTLSNQRRRLVLQVVAGRGQVTVRELTALVAAAECGIPAETLEYKQRKRVYTSLVQTHLPMLQKHGIVDYDKSRGTVAPATDLSAFDVYLEVVPENELHWSEFYLGLAAVFGVLTGLAWFGVEPFRAVSGLAYAGLFAVTLAVAAAVHLHSARRKRLDARERRKFGTENESSSAESITR